MKQFLLIFCLIFSCQAAFGQQLTGKVHDARTDQPVEGANVKYSQGKGTTTDAEGHFQIPCSESVSIRISHIGYRTYQKTINNCDMSLDVALVPLSYSMQKISVIEQADIQEASSVGTISKADLDKQTGLRLESALNTLPGVEMQSRSPWGGQRITIRGYYPNAGLNTNFNGLGYQLFLNNVPVTDATGTTIMDDIDFSTLGRVEVIKGPSPLYGNEIAGTVNLYSQRPDERGTSISEQLVGGSHGLFRNNITVMTKSAKSDLRINYGRQSYDSFRPHDSSEKDYVSVSGHFQVSDKQVISTYFSYNNSDEQLAGNISKDDFYAERAIAAPNYVNNDGGVEIESYRAGITSVHSFNPHLSNKTTVFATGHTLDQNFAHGFSYYENLNYGGRTNFMYQQQFENVGVNGQLGAFIQKSSESEDGVFIPPFISPPFTPSTQPQFPTNNENRALNYNLFTKWEFSLPHNFRISAGGVLNFNKFGIRNMLNNGSLYNGSSTKYKRFDPTFSPSISVLKSFNDQASVYASVNAGQTPPLLGDIIASDGSVNDQLSPEQAVQYEIGSKGHLMDGRFSYKLALFDIEISDRLVTQYENSIAYTTNAGKQQNRGLEVSAGYNILQDQQAAISLLKVWGSYTHSDFTYDDFKVYAQNSAGNDSLAADYSGNSVAGVAPNMVNLGIDMQTNPGFYLHLKYKYMDKTPVTFDNQEYVKSYNLLSGRIGYQKEFNHFDLDAFVGSNNLTSSTYYNFLFVGQNISSLGDNYISPAPYKATFYGGATLTYNF